MFPGSVDHARGRVRITHRAAHDGRRTSLADSRTAARHRRQLRGGHDRAGRRQFVGRRGGRRGLRRGLRATTTAATTEAATPTASSPAAPTATTSTAAATATSGRGTAATGSRGTAASSPSTSAASSPATGARATTEAVAVAVAETPGADRATAPPARRAADVPQTGPQTAAERTVAGVPDAAHHRRPGGVRRCRAAAAIIPLTRRDACPNGSY
ncbi:hypothetical protein RB201_20875 [Streptomyces sp. S1A(2023)]